MAGFEELEDYAEQSEDADLRMLIDIVDTYGEEIPTLLRKIKAMHVEDDDRDKADLIFSTLHRCKGMEYDAVTLCEDFITGERIRKLLIKEKEKPLDREMLSEEINLVYVGVTRSRNYLDFPRAMFPNADKARYQEKTAAKAVVKGLPKIKSAARAACMEGKRRQHTNAYKPWDEQQDADLRRLFGRGVSLKELSCRFGRNKGAIVSRLRKLGLGDE